MGKPAIYQAGRDAPHAWDSTSDHLVPPSPDQVAQDGTEARETGFAQADGDDDGPVDGYMPRQGSASTSRTTGQRTNVQYPESLPQETEVAFGTQNRHLGTLSPHLRRFWRAARAVEFGETEAFEAQGPIARKTVKD